MAMIYIPPGGGGGSVVVPTTVQDDTFDFTTTSVDVETDHPGLAVCSIVYSEISGLMWEKLDFQKWTRLTLDLS